MDILFWGLGHIGMLQATQMNQEVTIKDLESEKLRAHEKLSQLEEERAFLQNKSQSLNAEQTQQILELEKVKSSKDHTLPTSHHKKEIYILFFSDLI